MRKATVSEITCPRCEDRKIKILQTADFVQGACPRPGCLVLHYRVKAVSITIAQLRALQLLREGYEFREIFVAGGSRFRLYQKPRHIFGITVRRQTLAALFRKNLITMPLLSNNNGLPILNRPACESAEVWNQKPLR